MNIKTIIFAALVVNAAAFSFPEVNLKAFTKNISRKATATALSTLLLSNTLLPILPGGEAAAESRLVGEIAGSGIVFKDTLVRYYEFRN
jgi:hypothetical protein